ncbi:hypothetical protein CDAR_561561 [Caerostris darwini]|uniref:Uncharacterized protein n=1 Tax=Caerostris darwini TaxID=1538125 RepID=A0AAV4MIM4_9ARAC|nr:hypothetical protein CDAR_561561 [Caerostris darwini]
MPSHSFSSLLPASFEAAGINTEVDVVASVLCYRTHEYRVAGDTPHLIMITSTPSNFHHYRGKLHPFSHSAASATCCPPYDGWRCSRVEKEKGKAYFGGEGSIWIHTTYNLGKEDHGTHHSRLQFAPTKKKPKVIQNHYKMVQITTQKSSWPIRAHTLGNGKRTQITPCHRERDGRACVQKRSMR